MWKLNYVFCSGSCRLAAHLIFSLRCWHEVASRPPAVTPHKHILLTSLPSYATILFMKKYIPSEVEPKWQQKWAEEQLYKADLSSAKNKFYLTVEFTYTSGDLHIGHWFAFSVPDIFARFKRMEGFNVFFPNGVDAFGLPAENAAIKLGIHPKDGTLANIARMKEQFKLMGATYDWSYEVITCDPSYYKWNQWIFLKLFEKGLAYKGKMLSNWCPVDQTVLANENVEAGRCWRCGAEVVQKQVEQWFFKITEYADRLLWQDPPQVDWPKSLRDAQNNWIGKSQGVVIKFDEIEVFTTRQDTIFGATFIVISPEHPLLKSLIKPENEKLVTEYVAAAKKKSELERKEEKGKTGVFTGSFVTNPLNNQQVPVWVADYVLMGYGTGAIMGVPAHDERDFEFAKKYHLNIQRVIESNEPEDEAYEGEGIMINSGEYDGMESSQAREKISDYFEKHQLGYKKTNYHLHDWSISRQRYWGTPIPIINCQKCGVVPVPEKDLPVELPYQVDFSPTGKPPLATDQNWLSVKCPRCQGPAEREAETMDTFVDSAWYFLRYLDPKNKEQIFDKEVVKKWMPMDLYFGGAEHTLGHTLYSRFIVKFLKDIGLVEVEEYALKRVHHGVILGPDGHRMSKSRGNVVNPDEEAKKYGADAIRLYLAFLGPYDLVAPWNPDGINGVYHFLQRIWSLQEKIKSKDPDDDSLTQTDLKMMHKTIKKVTEDIENIKFNTAVAALMEWLNYLSAKGEVKREEYKVFLLLLAPFAPHITEELWQEMQLSVLSGQLSDEGQSVVGESVTGKQTTDKPDSENRKQKTENWSIHQQSWPKFDNKFLEEESLRVVVQINGKVRDTILIDKDIVGSKEKVENLARESEKVKKFLVGKNIVKTIYVPGKIINLVV